MHSVERLVHQARDLVLFPRADLAGQVRRLVGVDITAASSRVHVVPEGVDVRAAEQARRAVASRRQVYEPSVSDLLARLSALPSERHGLPLVLSVGRLNQLKGMARIVRAFGSDPQLFASANLVIVGGDLDAPTAVEAAELGRIEAALHDRPGLASGVVMLGHRPNAEVQVLLALARQGQPPLIGPCGAYACGSLKEEFGLAIVEAMAGGLPVVAPREGGPATYVEDGVTGALVDTAEPMAIARGLRAVLALSRDPRTAAVARAVVARRFTLDRMAATLASVYRGAASPVSGRGPLARVVAA
jgi:glycosyltransferase involved in cell wall biosynthesis